MNPVLVIVRFNLERASWFRIGRQPGYRERLYNPQRLERRQALFEDVTLSSLLGQSQSLDPSWFRLLVMTSDALPDDALLAMRRALDPLPWARLFRLAPEAPMRPHALRAIRELIQRPDGAPDDETPYATVRLDDDDALARPFLEWLDPHIRVEHRDHFVTFPNGIAGHLEDSNRFSRFNRLRYRCVSAGLAHIGVAQTITGEPSSTLAQVYEGGAHQKVDQRHPTLVDERGPAYLRTLHADQSSGNQGRSIYHRGQELDPTQVALALTLPPARLPERDQSSASPA
ncbi:glycosyltransferase [Brevundimonas lutea]|uniref:glycosyltransferase n=1 Tax=Brevundimonas lutea TaxID=2293980 RepID=UPI000F0444A9|nr:glycosyltransferase [Brevundimonas lutea]